MLSNNIVRAHVHPFFDLESDVAERRFVQRRAVRRLLDRMALGTAFVSLIGGSAAYAQTAGGPDPRTGAVEEIVVTAQKRSENLQKVPIAISALTAKDLATQGVSSTQYLSTAVPGLNMQTANGFGYIALRGVGSIATAPGFENVVAVYVDGVPAGGQFGNVFSFNNISRIEVLKGPQGTLFGGNVTGGLIHIITPDPTQEFKLKTDIGYGNYQTVTGNAYVSGGLSENLAADFSFHGAHQGKGWGENIVNGQDVYQTSHDISARSKLMYKPSEETKIILVGDYFTVRHSNNPYTIFENTISPLHPVFVNLPDHDVANDVQAFTKTKAYGGSVKIDQKIGEFNVSSISAYRKGRVSNQQDFDFTEVPTTGVTLLGKARQFTQEVQLSSSIGDIFKWTTGFFYLDSRGSFDPVAVNFQPTTPPPALRRIATSGFQNARSIAVYGQGTLKIADDTNLTLGARYTWEKHSARGMQILTSAAGVSTVAASGTGLKSKDDVPTFRVALDHQIADGTMIYASFTKGFKSGGFNSTTFPIRAYSPETLKSYEAGVKSEIFNRRLRINVSGFYYDYTNMQQLLLLSASTVILNAATSRTYGADIDVVAVLTDRLRLTANAGILDAKFKSFPSAPTSNPRGGVPVTNGPASGNRIPLGAKFTSNVAVDYALPLDTAKIDLNVAYYYNSGYYFEPDNAIKQKAFGRLAASLRWTSQNGGMTVTLWGRNLNDSYVAAYANTASNGTHRAVYQAPRTYGLTIGFSM